MSFVAIDCSRKICEFTFVDKGKPPVKAIGDFDKVNAFVGHSLQRAERRVFVFQGLSDVAVVRDDSPGARKSYECKRALVGYVFSFCCLASFFPCFTCCMKFESPNTLYSDITGETFLFKDRVFLIDIRKSTKTAGEVKALLEEERDNDPNITKARRAAIKEALKVNGAFNKFKELLDVARLYPEALILIDSEFGINGLAKRVKNYTATHFEGITDPMKR